MTMIKKIITTRKSTFYVFTFSVMIILLKLSLIKSFL